jgi:hypothetical protein
VLSHHNHFKFGYSGQWFRLRESPYDVFNIEYGRCTTEPGNFRDASIRAAKLIGEAADAPIHVLFSGGIDSEVAMLSFLAAEVPITAAILRFQDDINQHDIAFAIEFCDTHHVPYKLYDLDIRQFMAKQVWDYTTPVRCNAPMLAATMWLIDAIDGYPVMGQGEPFLLRPKRMRPHRLPQARLYSYYGNVFTDTQWALQESESVNSWYRHYLLRGRNGVPAFHQYTPEQVLAYLRDPYVIEMMATSDEMNNEKWKLPHYRRYFDLRDRPKYTGYEPIMDEIAVCRAQHSRAFPHTLSFVLFDCERLTASLAA